MGSIITKIQDDYDTYVEFCKLVAERPVGMSDPFYEHEKQLMQQYGYVKDGCWYKQTNNNI